MNVNALPCPALPGLHARNRTAWPCCRWCVQAPVAALCMWCVPTDLRPLGVSMMTVSIHLLGDVPSPPLVGLLQVGWRANSSAWHGCNSSHGLRLGLLLPSALASRVVCVVQRASTRARFFEVATLAHIRSACRTGCKGHYAIVNLNPCTPPSPCARA